MHPTGRTGRFRDLSLDDFTERLESPDPVPGGGSASAVAAAIGASLLTMVGSLTSGKPKYVDHEPMLAWAMESGRRLSDRLLTLADDDAEAFAGFSAALKMPRETDIEIAARTAAMQAAARRASEVPLSCVEGCLELVQVAEALAGRSNPNASSDIAVAALLGEAAARGAAANVMINLPSTGDAELAGRLTRQVTELLATIDDLTSQTHQVIGSGDRREPLDPAGPA